MREVARVLSRYVDLIGVRAFPKFKRWEDDRRDAVLQGFARHATVPVINLETHHPPLPGARARPRHAGAHGHAPGQEVRPHVDVPPEPLNTAVANSAVLIATKLGMDVTLLCPDERYLLDERYLDAARKNAADERAGASPSRHDIDQPTPGADMVYAKSWGAIPFFGRWERRSPSATEPALHRRRAQDGADAATALFSHCLPVRRNVKVTDAVIDSPRRMVIEEAENRLHVQKAVMDSLVNGL